MNDETTVETVQSIPTQEVSQPTYSSVSSGSDSSSGKIKWIVLGVIVLIVLAAVGWFIFGQPKDEEVEVLSTPEAVVVDDVVTEPTEAPLPSSSPAASDRSKVKIEVQNGTGISGEAAYLQNQLKTLGYTDVTTGNASVNQTKTTVTFASTVASDLVAEITTKLKALYTTVETKTGVNTNADIVVITGLRKGVTPKPSVSPTPKPSASASATATSTPTATP